MNILYIEHYAGSPTYGMEFRPFYLSREWVKQGHQVTIIGSSFSHLRQRNPEVKEDFQEETIDGIKYVWMKGNEYKGSLSRIRDILTFVWKLKCNARRIVKMYHPDLVIASSTYPLDNYPAYKIAKLSKAKYTYEVHDLWPLSPMVIGGYSKWHPFIWVMQRAEDFAYKHVDKVISLLDRAEPHMIEHGLPEGKFVWVTNGYNPEEWTEEAFNRELPEVHQKAFDRLKGKLIVGFAGGLAASGSLPPLIKAASLLKDMENLHVVIVGKGPEEVNLKNLVQQLQLDNVTFLPPVSKNMMASLDSHFDICYIAGVKSVLSKYGGAANKLTDYMLCGKPIVNGTDNPEALVEKIGCGLRAEAENPEAMAAIIRRIAEMTNEQRQAMGEKGKVYAKQNRPWAALADKFLKAFE